MHGHREIYNEHFMLFLVLVNEDKMKSHCVHFGCFFTGSVSAERLWIKR